MANMYLDEEARKRQQVMAGAETPEEEAQEASYMDSDSRRDKPKGAVKGRQATQAEEQQYMLAVKQAMQFLGQNKDTLLQQAQSQDPAQSIASMAVNVIKGISQSASSKGVNLSDELLLAVGYQFAVSAAGLLAAMGIIAQDEIESLVEQAVGLGREMAMQQRG